MDDSDDSSQKSGKNPKQRAKSRQTLKAPKLVENVQTSSGDPVDTPEQDDEIESLYRRLENIVSGTAPEERKLSENAPMNDEINSSGRRSSEEEKKPDMSVDE